jgi:hypothetical protein
VNTSGPLHSIKQMRVSMKRLMIVTALLLATVSTSVWAQAPATATDAPRNPPQAAAPVPMQPAQSGAMPMTNCAGNHESAVAGNETNNCPMVSGDVKSDQGGMHMHRMMMQGMMHSQPQSGAMQPDQNQGGTPKTDKLQ